MEWWKYLLIGIPLLLVLVYYGSPRALHTLGLHPSNYIQPFEFKV